VRIIHTSDWHIGQTFHGYDRYAEHEVFLDWLVDQLEERQADALLVAGDIFDQANPAAEAQRIFFRFLSSARRRCPDLAIVVVAGNHDSPGRIEAPNPVLQGLDIHIVGSTADATRLRVPLRDRDGVVRAWALAMPFLRPADLPRAGTYPEAVADAYRALTAEAVAQREPGQALIALGHLHVQGGKVSESSERRLVIGGEEALDAGTFPAEIAYVALGHLHLAQELGSGRVRYCGSPLPLSFTEIAYPHQVVQVDFEGENVREIVAIPVPRATALMRVPEQHASLEDVISRLENIELPQCPDALRPFLEVRVMLDRADTTLRARVDEALAEKPVRLARIDVVRCTALPDNIVASPAPRLSLQELSPELVFKRLLSQGDADEAELLEAFSELVHGAEEAT
jgi:exonuclease SbcD